MKIIFIANVQISINYKFIFLKEDIDVGEGEKFTMEAVFRQIKTPKNEKV